MADKSTILLRKRTIEMLKKAKIHPRQSYDDLLATMGKALLEMKHRNQYDEFLHKVQQEKMKELWENEEDEDWEHV